MGFGTRILQLYTRELSKKICVSCVLDGIWNIMLVWLVADGWCWFVLREKYCWLEKSTAGRWLISQTNGTEFSDKAHRAGGVASERVMIATHGMEPARAKPLRTKRKGEES
jgi:hypothetical protein